MPFDALHDDLLAASQAAPACRRRRHEEQGAVRAKGRGRGRGQALLPGARGLGARRRSARGLGGARQGCARASGPRWRCAWTGGGARRRSAWAFPAWTWGPLRRCVWTWRARRRCVWTWRARRRCVWAWRARRLEALRRSGPARCHRSLGLQLMEPAGSGPGSPPTRGCQPSWRVRGWRRHRPRPRAAGCRQQRRCTARRCLLWRGRLETGPR